MAYKVRVVNLKDKVYQLCCKKRYYSQCTAVQLLQELKEAGVKFEDDRSYEQLSQILSQLIQENKIWLAITNLIGSATLPGVEFRSVENIEEDLKGHFGYKCVIKTVKLVRERLGKDFWSHDLHYGERIEYLEDVRWNRNVAWLRK